MKHNALHFHVPLDISDFPTRHNYVLALWQNLIERTLPGWVEELGTPMVRGVEVNGFAQDQTSVDVQLSDAGSLRAQHLVGCDGGRNLIRKAAGRNDSVGTHAIGKLEDGRRARMVLTEQHVGTTSEPTLRDLREALTAVYGTNYGIHSQTWISRVHRHEPSGRSLPRQAGAAGGRAAEHHGSNGAEASG